MKFVYSLVENDVICMLVELLIIEILESIGLLLLLIFIVVESVNGKSLFSFKLSNKLFVLIL